MCNMPRLAERVLEFGRNGLFCRGLVALIRNTYAVGTPDFELLIERLSPQSPDFLVTV